MRELDATPAPASAPAGGGPVVPGTTETSSATSRRGSRPRARAKLPRAPAYRQARYPRLHPLRELGSWPAAVARAMDEAKGSCPSRSRGVLALVLVVMEACMRARHGRVSLTRRAIADALGYRGQHAEESVRKLMNRAWELGELVVYDGQGYRAPGARGWTAPVLVPVRLLQYLSQLAGARRAEVLSDPLVVEALQAREDAISREIGAGAPPRPPPVLYGRERACGPEFAKAGHLAGEGCFTGSETRDVSDRSPEAAGPNATEGGGAAAPDRSDGAPHDAASSAGQQRPAPVAPAELAGETPPAPATVPCPPPGPEAREAGPEAPPGAATRGQEDEGRRDPDRLRAELHAVRGLLLEARHRALSQAPLRPWAVDRDRELAATRDLDGRLARAERAASDAKFAALRDWKNHRAAREAHVLQAETPADRSRRRSDYDAQQGPETPTPWVAIWSLLLECDDTGSRFAVLARCRVRWAGDDLELVAPDRFAAGRVRDTCSQTIEAAAKVAGFEGTIRVVSP